MDLETEALLFSKPTGRKREKFRSTLFAEFSTKELRNAKIYGLLAHRVWVGLESDLEVESYNEKPLEIKIPNGSGTFGHQFKFVARARSGVVTAIDIDRDDAEGDKLPDENLRAIEEWCKAQGITYKRVSRLTLAGEELRLSNLQVMLKFIESARKARDPLLEERINLLVASAGPVSVRQLLDGVAPADETVAIAHVARGILSGRFTAPIGRRSFDGALIVDLAR